MMMWRALRPREIVTALQSARHFTPPAQGTACAPTSGGAKNVTETGTANDPYGLPVPPAQPQGHAKKYRGP